MMKYGRPPHSVELSSLQNIHCMKITVKIQIKPQLKTENIFPCEPCRSRPHEAGAIYPTLSSLDTCHRALPGYLLMSNASI